MLINGIDTKDISVVIVGLVNKFTTPICIASVRKHLPGAEIILSTWKGSNTEGLDYDQLVLSKDPGGFDFFNMDRSIQNSFDRQVVSTSEGLKRAKRKYAVKLRSDFALESAGFLSWFEKFPAKNDAWSLFHHKVICGELYSRNPRIKHARIRQAMHPSDLFFFGRTDDLTELFDAPLIPEEERFYFAHKHPDEFAVILPRYVPEQYLWNGFIKRRCPNAEGLLEDVEDVSRSAVHLTEATFASNLIILSAEQTGVRCMKNSVLTDDNDSGGCYSHFDWYCLYMRFCRNRFGLYGLFRLRTFLKDLRYHFSRPSGQMPHRVWNALYGKLAPLLTPEEKAQLAPLYERLKAAFFRLRGSHDGKRHVESYFNEPVTDADISVVVQGAVSSATKDCLESIRRTLPRAEIVLSTWEGTDTSDLDFDKVVFNEDPGPCGLIRRFPHKHTNNVNRQITSSLSGVLAATRRYCIKLRGDMLISSTAFLEFYNKYSQYISPDAPFSRRVMVEGLTTTESVDFGVSDWWYFGLRADLEKLFDIPLMMREEIPYFEQLKNAAHKPVYSDIVCQYVPETYIIWQFARKNIPEVKTLTFKHQYDSSESIRMLHQRLLVGAFLPLEFTKSGVTLPKASNMADPSGFIGCLPFEKWRRLCRDWRTLPSELLQPELDKEGQEQGEAYKKAPGYYNVLRYSSIIQNYAKLSGQETFPIEPIQKRDITFVVSGKIILEGELNARRCLSSVRRFFPASRIVLSTWEGEPVEALKGLYDELVLLQEPEGERPRFFLSGHPDKRTNSVNLQQFSVHEGMKRVRTKYAVRLRTDYFLINDNFLRFYKQWSGALRRTEGTYRLFQSRVLVPQSFTQDIRKAGIAYGLSDCFQFGLTKDLLKLWDGHRESFETMNWFEEHPYSSWENPFQFNHRFNAEQCSFLNTVRKAGLDVQIPEWYFDHGSDRLAFEWEKVLASNVIVGNHCQLGLGAKFPDYALGVTPERLFELYLYNVDPGNKECLDFLKKQYTLPPVKKRPAVLVYANVALRCAKMCLLPFVLLAKRIMRMLLPAYRVGVGMRERQITFEAEEGARFNYLAMRVNTLEEILRKNEAELQYLKTQQIRRRARK